MTQAADTRDRLVQTAFELFLRQGYTATGIAQILKQANVNSGSLYHYFPTKEDLLIATLEWCKANLWSDVMQPVVERVSDPLERVFGVLDGYRQMLVLTECGQGCPIGNLALELAESHPRVRQLLVENFEGWRNQVRECLDAASGRLPEHVDRDQLALFVLTTMEGAVMLARTYKSLDVFDSAVTQLRDYVERLVADGTTWSAPQTKSSSALV